MSRKTVYILATGGTISGKGAAGKAGSYQDGAFDISSLLAEIPEAQELANLEGEQVLNISSDDITTADWLMLAERIRILSERGDICGFVVTHGTNTLEETAFFLELTVATDKPVVLTGAMRPATALSADGSMNLYQAIALAANPQAAGQGVLVCFADGIYSALDVQKGNCMRPQGFSGRGGGCLGFVQDDQVFWHYRRRNYDTIHGCFSTMGLSELPEVMLVHFHAGASPALLQYALDNADGVVIAGAGAALCSREWYRVLKSRQGRARIVGRAAKVPDGVVPYGERDAEYQTLAGYRLTPEKLRILLMLGLSKGLSMAELQQYAAEL